MNLRIHNPELVERLNTHIQTGHFHDADEVLEKALDALEESVISLASAHRARKSDLRTGADLIADLKDSPSRELDIEPTRFRPAIPARDVTF